MRIINHDGVHAATVPAIAAAAGVEESVIWANYDSVGDVFATMVDNLVRIHSDEITPTIIRRRSLTESMKVMLFTFWNSVESQPEAHIATKHLRLVDGDEFDRASGRALYNSFLATTERGLRTMEEIHGIVWERPVNLLARMMIATLDGMVLEYTVTRDSVAARQLLELLAYHLAQHGRRSSKNHPQ